MVDANTYQSGAGYPALVVQQSNQNQTGTTNFTNSQNGAQNPIFTAGQQAMQGQAQDLYSQIMSGNVQNFGLDKATRDAAWYDFSRISCRYWRLKMVSAHRLSIPLPSN
jgi:hypothetical protein